MEGADSIPGLRDVHTETNETFGWEWKRWGDYGWNKVKSGQIAGYSEEDARDDFVFKTLLSQEDLGTETLTLDGGVGNGRFAYQAAQFGGRVIGVDLSAGAVVTASDNLSEENNVQVVQANLFNLPFPTETFDAIYSLGVLQHTGDAEGAFDSLTDHLTKGGVISAHVYHPQHHVWEAIDRALRALTTRLSPKQCLLFSQALSIVGRAFRQIDERAFQAVNQIFRVDSRTHVNFDWYSAPVATRHPYGEVINWFHDRKLHVLKTNMRRNYGQKMVIWPFIATVKGMKPSSDSSNPS